MLKKIFERLVADLKKRGEAVLTESVEKLSSTLEKEATTLLQRGEVLIREKLTDAQKVVAEKIDPRFAELLNFGSGDNKAYSTIITDDPHHPFQINDVIKKNAQIITRGATEDLAKAKAIFDWFEQNVDYGAKKRADNLGYRTSKEVFTDREGVCGEMAVLYIVMARSVGLRANYVSVTMDNQNKDVAHACAAVYLGRKPTLVDPAYHTFDVKHRKFTVKTDADAVPHLKIFRGRTN